MASKATFFRDSMTAKEVHQRQRCIRWKGYEISYREMLDLIGQIGIQNIPDHLREPAEVVLAHFKATEGY